MEFAFLDRQKQLVIFIPTDCKADGIGRSTINIALEINTWSGKDFIVKANTL